MRLPAWLRLTAQRVGSDHVTYNFDLLTEVLTEMYNQHSALPDTVVEAWGMISNDFVIGSMWDFDPPRLTSEPSWDAQEVYFTAEEKAEPIYTRKREARPRDVFDRESYKPEPSRVDHILDGLGDLRPGNIRDEVWLQDPRGVGGQLGARCDQVWIDEFAHLHLYDS